MGDNERDDNADKSGSSMNPILQTGGQGRSETANVPPAVPDGSIPGAGVHGAETNEPRGGEASAMAREGAAKAFPESSDSDYLDPANKDDER